ncbi:MAG: HAD-IA family hydrolase [Ignavibacteriales bacterium]|nr:HAD-IA family hydrolase [Ignavibacteriales bacterium]
MQKRSFNITVGHFDLLVCYHDVVNKKPHPESMFKVIEHFNVSASECLALGDRAIGCTSANAAGCASAACYWGTDEPNLLRGSQADFHFESPDQIKNHLR